MPKLKETLRKRREAADEIMHERRRGDSAWQGWAQEVREPKGERLRSIPPRSHKDHRYAAIGRSRSPPIKDTHRGCPSRRRPYSPDRRRRSPLPIATIVGKGRPPDHLLSFPLPSSPDGHHRRMTLQGPPHLPGARLGVPLRLPTGIRYPPSCEGGPRSHIYTPPQKSGQDLSPSQVENVTMRRFY
jgi:hypothetical protein